VAASALSTRSGLRSTRLVNGAQKTFIGPNRSNDSIYVIPHRKEQGVLLCMKVVSEGHLLQGRI